MSAASRVHMTCTESMALVCACAAVCTRTQRDSAGRRCGGECGCGRGCVCGVVYEGACWTRGVRVGFDLTGRRGCGRWCT
ncbi:hypothetical protein B0H16DRAFT_1567501 [Mycena metata]|uniref:Secreted protein n=1 Tax=Mycena metata TaxID=1033252 RepID=A0AAD7IDL8_9AGAR|nr:hypothetical protein B0H16DRAFT_1567501 [Mycena metata]